MLYSANLHKKMTYFDMVDENYEAVSMPSNGFGVLERGCIFHCIHHISDIVRDMAYMGYPIEPKFAKSSATLFKDQRRQPS